MRTIRLCFVVTTMLLLAGVALAHGTRDQSVDVKKVETMILSLIPDVTVDAVSMSQVPGLYEVVLNSPDSSKSVLYLSVDMKHIIAGSILDMERGKNLTEKRFMDLNRIDTSTIPLDDALVLGSTEAKHRIIVFDDPD